MRDNDWIGKKYVVLVVYGEFKEEVDVYFGNRTNPFDH